MVILAVQSCETTTRQWSWKKKKIKGVEHKRTMIKNSLRWKEAIKAF